MSRAVHAGSPLPRMPNGCWAILVALRRLMLLPNSIRNRAPYSRVARGMVSLAAALYLRTWPDGRRLLQETALNFSAAMEDRNALPAWSAARSSLGKWARV